MQLNDILEENSIKSISQKTKISEENIENLFNQNFSVLKKIKTLGFISIIEREYHVDLSDLRQEAQEYYANKVEDPSVTLGLPIVEEKKGKSKLLIWVVLVLLGYATWYFLTQFDQKRLHAILPFVDEEMIASFMDDKKPSKNGVEALSIAKVSVKQEEQVQAKDDMPSDAKGISSDIASQESTSSVEDDATNQVKVTQTVEDITPTVQMEKIVSIVPEKRLWFGLVNAKTQEREYFTISASYELNVTSQSWLVATSSASFSLRVGSDTMVFNNAKEHYFKIDANGTEVLDKSEYVALGGWAQW